MRCFEKHAQNYYKQMLAYVSGIYNKRHENKNMFEYK